MQYTLLILQYTFGVITYKQSDKLATIQRIKCHAYDREGAADCTFSQDLKISTCQRIYIYIIFGLVRPSEAPQAAMERSAVARTGQGAEHCGQDIFRKIPFEKLYSVLYSVLNSVLYSVLNSVLYSVLYNVQCINDNWLISLLLSIVLDNLFAYSCFQLSIQGCLHFITGQVRTSSLHLKKFKKLKFCKTRYNAKRHFSRFFKTKKRLIFN